MSIAENQKPIELAELLTLSKTGDNEFRGKSLWMPQGRVFGGQVMAQALVSASNTVGAERAVHSLHGYFLKAGDIEADIDFAVEVLRDGRSFSTRRVQAIQHGRPIFSMIASFQTQDEGLDHQQVLELDIPNPESLPSAKDLLGGIDHPSAQYWAHSRPFDIRHFPDPIYTQVSDNRDAEQAVWLRAINNFPADSALNSAALAFASDYTILEPSLRRHGIAWSHPGLSSASLDHAMWFHRPIDVNKWMLYLQKSPSAQGGRGLSTGQIYQDGILVASVTQEGMLRIPKAL